MGGGRGTGGSKCSSSKRKEECRGKVGWLVGKKIDWERGKRR